jgi:hypothetical protein
MMKKSNKSGILWGSVGQYVGEPVDRKEKLLDWINLASSRPFVVISLDPHRVCLLLKSPPTINLGPRVWKNAAKCSSLRLCRGGQ